MSNNPSPKKPAWKKGGPEKAPQAPQRGWKKDTPAGAPTGASRKVKLLGALTGFCVLLAALFALIYWLRMPKPTALVLVVSGYETNLALPQNAPGRNTINAFKELTEKKDSSFVNFALQSPERDFREKADWEPPAKMGQLKENVFLIVFSVHGISDGQRNYLLRDGGSLWDLNVHLKLDDVLTTLKGMDPEKKKVLVLDVALMTSHWPIGLIHNDFVRNLKEHYAKDIADIPNLVVLCGTEVNQRSWHCPEWGRSVYLHYLLEGLKGASDNDQQGVSAFKLHRYAASHTEQWVFDNRKDSQTPLLLPDGEEGERRARGINLAPVVKDYVAQKPSVKAFAAGSLPDAWKKWDTLRKQQPAPWVYAPHLWKLYSQAVLRYEELLLVNADAGRVGEAGKLVDTYHDALANLRVERLDAAAFALPLAAVAGDQLTPEKRKTIEPLASRLFGAPDARKAWDETKAQLSAGDQLLVGQELYRYSLYEVLRADQVTELRNRSGVFGKVRQALETPNVRPAEVHFAVMMALEGQQEQFTRQDVTAHNSLMLKALQSRLQAEELALGFDPAQRTYPYAEHLLPWIQARLALFDESRRHAEDWLFAQKWDKATAEYKNVTTNYTLVQEDVQRLRQALAVRDEALAQLPWLSQALATLEETTSEEVAAETKLWELVHELDQALNTEPANAPDLKVQVDKIDGMARQVRQSLEKRRADYLKQVRDLTLEQPNPGRLRRLQVLALVPDLDSADRRAELATKLRDWSGKLLSSTESEERKIDSKGQDKDYLQNVRKHVARQGGLLLWSVGKYHMLPGEFEGLAPVGQDNVNVLDAAAHASPKLRAAWKRLEDKAEEAMVSLPSKNLDGCRTQLRIAERAGRHLSVASALQFEAPGHNPGVLSRKQRLYDLMIWLTDRNRQDFWHWDNPRQTDPYYVVAGRAYLADAVKLLEKIPEAKTPELKKARAKEAEDLKELLDSKPRLDLAGLPPRLHITSELEYDLDFTLNVPRTVPRGFPYITFLIQDTKYLSQDEQEKRRVARVEKDTPEVKGRLRLINQLLKRQAEQGTPDFGEKPQLPTKVNLSYWFRGHIGPHELDVRMYPYANNVAADEPAQNDRSSLTVAGKGFRPNDSGLVIVLDCSGSMIFKGTIKEGRTRFERIKEALFELLANVPPDTTLSLWVYGQTNKLPGQRAARPGKNEEEAEATICHLLPPVKSRTSMLDNIKAKVLALEPKGYTPLTRSIVEARKDLADWEEGGSRKKGFSQATLIVLTDGEDTCFEPNKDLRVGGDPDFNPNGELKIGDFLERQFRESSISVRIVGYELNKDELLVAERQFGSLKSKLGNKFTLENTGDLVQLKRMLIRASQQKLLFSVKNNNTDQYEVKNHELPPSRQVPAIPLKPGDYTVEVEGTRIHRQRVSLASGDALNLRVKEKSGSTSDLEISRDPLTGEFRDKVPIELNRKDKDGKVVEQWALTNLFNKRMASPPGQAILVTLERQDQQSVPSDDSVTVMGPGFVWMEVQKLDSESRPLRLNWGRQQGWPAPTWTVNAAWTSEAELDSEARLMIWLSSGKPTPEQGFIEKDTHWKLGEMGKPGERLDAGNRLLDGKVRLESVRIEKHLIRFGTSDQLKEQYCLVVRASYDPDAQVFFEPDMGADRAPPAVHHYYTQANKYTGYYLLPESRARDVKNLRMYSLATFKNQAQTLSGVQKLTKPRTDDKVPDGFERSTPAGPGS